ncbi:hypothetical protein BDZ91DRAFT_735957, partial [Kalaharituber pfeilii]
MHIPPTYLLPFLLLPIPVTTLPTPYSLWTRLSNSISSPQPHSGLDDLPQPIWPRRYLARRNEEGSRENGGFRYLPESKNCTVFTCPDPRPRPPTPPPPIPSSTTLVESSTSTPTNSTSTAPAEETTPVEIPVTSTVTLILTPNPVPTPPELETTITAAEATTSTSTTTTSTPLRVAPLSDPTTTSAPLIIGPSKCTTVPPLPSADKPLPPAKKISPPPRVCYPPPQNLKFLTQEALYQCYLERHLFPIVRKTPQAVCFDVVCMSLALSPDFPVDEVTIDEKKLFIQVSKAMQRIERECGVGWTGMAQGEVLVEGVDGQWGGESWREIGWNGEVKGERKGEIGGIWMVVVNWKDQEQMKRMEGAVMETCFRLFAD